ncbi:MAG: hypothetical protein GY807_15810 [Gammaproteobacteria bacterium]|nr:hypothetical protein [Gammaproteobacteria bacterium]
MSVFHSEPERQRRFLEELTERHQMEFTLGERTMKIVINPVVDDDGQRLGTAVEWSDRTQELGVEREVDTIVDGAGRGDLNQRISLADKTGFFSVLGGGINELLEVIERVTDDTVRVLGAIARGDLTEIIQADYQGAFAQLKHDANTSVEKLTEVIGDIQDATDTLSSNSAEIAQGNANLSQRTESQVTSLEETASSMEELTGTVRQNAENAEHASQLARGTREAAEKGSNVVRQSVAAMGEINESSKKISEAIGVINEVAFQTNLLALNASVEAAGAGEQGRGFAVVAGEVRNLAHRSASAAKEIEFLIKDSGVKVAEGSRLVEESGETLDEIVVAVKKVSDIIAGIAAASVEQSSGIEQVNKAVMDMDGTTQQNSALVEEVATASASMSEQAERLTGLTGFFTVTKE